MALPISRLSPLCRMLLGAVLCVLASRVAFAQRSSVTGVVKDSAGRPMADVEVRITGAAVRSLTNEQGVYHLSGVLAGPAMLVARHIGFRPFSVDVRLLPGTEHRVDVNLVPSSTVLEGVQVVATREAFESRLAGFNARRQQKVGHFVTRERIDRANSTVLSDMLREVPGVKVIPTPNLGRAIRLRGSNCAPLVFVDGFPATAGEFDVDIIDLQSVEGIEVYAGLGTIPPEFMGPRDLDRCGVIAIWSRPARAKHRAAFVLDSLNEAARVTALGDVLTTDEVDVAARLDAGTPAPHYPDSLFTAKVAGRVVVEFVVDTSGNVEPATVDVLASTHPLFTLAVRSSLAEAHFSVAIAHGRKVRQYLQVPYSFAITDAPSSHP